MRVDPARYGCGRGHWAIAAPLSSGLVRARQGSYGQTLSLAVLLGLVNQREFAGATITPHWAPQAITTYGTKLGSWPVCGSVAQCAGMSERGFLLIIQFKHPHYEYWAPSQYTRLSVYGGRPHHWRLCGKWHPQSVERRDQAISARARLETRQPWPRQPETSRDSATMTASPGTAAVPLSRGARGPTADFSPAGRFLPAFACFAPSCDATAPSLCGVRQGQCHRPVSASSLALGRHQSKNGRHAEGTPCRSINTAVLFQYMIRR